MSLVMFTARAGATCPIPVKALEWGATAGPPGSPLDSLIGPKLDIQSPMQESAGREGTGLPGVLLKVQRVLGIREQCTNY